MAFNRTLSRLALSGNVMTHSHTAVMARPCNAVVMAIDTRFKSTKSNMVKPVVIDKNLSLRYCQTTVTGDSHAFEPSLFVGPVEGSRPLVVLLSWLMAREGNLEKYRSIYFKHGFDVLTVKTRPFEMLLPTMGSQRVALNLFNFLKNKVSTYPNVLIHAFSVGAYQFSEMLCLLQEGLSRQEVDGSCEIVRKAIKGMIFDSAVDVDGAAYGISRSVAGDGLSADLLEKSIKGYMRAFHNVATKHYEKSSKAFRNTPLRCPALMLLSREDRLGNPINNTVVADRWRELGIDVTLKCWEKSRHVAHLHKYPDEYVYEVNNFLKRINLGIHEQKDRDEFEMKFAAKKRVMVN